MLKGNKNTCIVLQCWHSGLRNHLEFLSNEDGEHQQKYSWLKCSWGCAGKVRSKWPSRQGSLRWSIWDNAWPPYLTSTNKLQPPMDNQLARATAISRIIPLHCPQKGTLKEFTCRRRCLDSQLKYILSVPLMTLEHPYAHTDIPLCSASVATSAPTEPHERARYAGSWSSLLRLRSLNCSGTS